MGVQQSKEPSILAIVHHHNSPSQAVHFSCFVEFIFLPPRNDPLLVLQFFYLLFLSMNLMAGSMTSMTLSWISASPKRRKLKAGAK